MKKILLPVLLFALVYTTVCAQTEANFDLAEQSYSKHNYTQAETYYSRYIQGVEPKLADYLQTMATYDTCNLFEKSSKFPNFSINHKWAVAYYERGMCYLNMNSSAKAGSDFETSMKIDPDYAGPYLQKGLLIKGTNKNQACVYFSKARWLNDTDKSAKNAYRDNFCWMCGINLAKKGKTEVELKNFSIGIMHLDSAIIFCHDSANYYAYRGIAYEGRGKMDSAIADYSTAIKLDSNSYMGYYRRGLTYSTAQKYKEAFNDFSRTLILNPKFADAYKYRADACENLNMESSMVFDYQQLLKLKPNEGIAWYKLALHKKKLGQDACDYFQKALDLGIDDAQSSVDDCNAAAAKRNLK